MSKLVRNAAGRRVPTEVNGVEQVPYQGVGKFEPEGRKAAPPVRQAGADAIDFFSGMRERFANRGSVHVGRGLDGLSRAPFLCEGLTRSL